MPHSALALLRYSTSHLCSRRAQFRFKHCGLSKNAYDMLSYSITFLWALVTSRCPKLLLHTSVRICPSFQLRVKFVGCNQSCSSSVGHQTPESACHSLSTTMTTITSFINNCCNEYISPCTSFRDPPYNRANKE